MNPSKDRSVLSIEGLILAGGWGHENIGSTLVGQERPWESVAEIGGVLLLLRQALVSPTLPPFFPLSFTTKKVSYYTTHRRKHFYFSSKKFFLLSR